MKKSIYTRRNTFLGRALKIETTGNDVEITMPGDFQGWQKTVTYVGGSIVYEDENRFI